MRTGAIACRISSRSLFLRKILTLSFRDCQRDAQQLGDLALWGKADFPAVVRFG